MAIESTTTIEDLPDVILFNIMSSLTDTRTRNSLSLVNLKFHALERATRTSLSVRGKALELYRIPLCFRSTKNLDLSKLSPWGQSILSSPDDPDLVARRLRWGFPLVESLTIYSRSSSTLQISLPQLPRLRHVKLVRWHQRPQCALGADLIPLFEHCEALTSLDLSNFYFYTEDLVPALRAYPAKSANLTCLNLLPTPITEGFKRQAISEITAACPNLNKFLVSCIFDRVYLGFSTDETLTAIATNCPKLSLLHLVHVKSLSTTVRGDPDNDAFAAKDATISCEGLIHLFNGLPLLEELVLDVGLNVRNSGLALEELQSKCDKLKVLKLGQFHGVCLAKEHSLLDGVALCKGLESLSIKNCGDLTDKGLIAIGRGCCRLAKFEVEGCKNITFLALRTLVFFVRKTLVEVRISCCKQLGALASCKAMDPICSSIRKLHIDCVWNGFEPEGSDSSVHTFNLNQLIDEDDDDLGYRTKRKVPVQFEDSMQSKGSGFLSKTWKMLKYLSLWIEVGQVLIPLSKVGLADCPELEEIRIKVEGDTRNFNKPEELALGLSCLSRYTRLSKLQLDCSDTLGYALTAPIGKVDLTVWDRFFLIGIGNLRLHELHYRPTFDMDVNHRSLTVPAVLLIAQCRTLRKLFIYGTAHEQTMMVLNQISNLRDAQLRIDYYSAPDPESLTTELRLDSYNRFEAALNGKRIPD